MMSNREPSCRVLISYSSVSISDDYHVVGGPLWCQVPYQVSIPVPISQSGTWAETLTHIITRISYLFNDL